MERQWQFFTLYQKAYLKKLSLMRILYNNHTEASYTHVILFSVNRNRQVETGLNTGFTSLCGRRLPVNQTLILKFQ